jgi:hypothetical protein
MPDSYSVSSDKKEKVKLTPSLVSAHWLSSVAFGGQEARCEVLTAFVGQGAPIKITGKSDNGKKIGKIEGEMRGNRFIGAIPIPDDIEDGDYVYFEVELSKNSLKGESDRIPARPAVVVSELNWGASVAARGDIVTLSGKVSSVPSGWEITLVVYEYDDDGCHDPVVELPAQVRDGKFELKWEYQYYEDTDEIPTQGELDTYDAKYAHPEYFFTVRVDGTEYGAEQASGLLRFKDFLKLQVLDERGEPMANEKYVLRLADGTERKGNLNSDGFLEEEDLPPGEVIIEWPDLDDIEEEGD